MARITDYTDPATVDVQEVGANINIAFEMRGDKWDDTPCWPNITVKALADRIEELETARQPRFDIEGIEAMTFDEAKALLLLAVEWIDAAKASQ